MRDYNLVARIHRLKRLDLVDAIEVLTGTSFKRSAKHAYPDGDDECPCGRHQHNFRIDQEAGKAYCFSPGCKISGDLIDVAKAYWRIDLREAVGDLENVLAPELSALDGEVDETGHEIVRPVALNVVPAVREPVGITNPTEDDFRFLGACQQVFVRDRRASKRSRDYLHETRRHSPRIVDTEGVGYTAYSLGYSLQSKKDPKVRERMGRLGLLTDEGYDVAKSGLITFPIRNRDGRICGFRFKDPDKKFMAQQRRKGLLDSVLFLGEHTLKDLLEGSPLVVCEGEHDFISLMDHGWRGGLLATCGAISKDQLQALVQYSEKYRLITVFDHDAAGDVYRQWLSEEVDAERIRQIVPPGVGNDPDSFLRGGGHLADLFGEVLA